MGALTSLAREVAVDERTLRATRLGPRTLELPLSERVYVRRSWPLISALRDALRTESNVRFALLFGSTATGADTPESDIDVLVDLRDASFERVIDLSTKLRGLVGRPVDVVELHDAESEPAFLAQAVVDGRVLVDRDGLWPRLHRREVSLRSRGSRQEAQRLHTALAGIDRLLAS